MKQIHDVNYINEKQLANLNSLLKEIIKTNLFYQSKYSNALTKINKGKLTRFDFFKLPFLEKDELIQDQLSNPPYGTNLTYTQDEYLFTKPTYGSSGKTPLKIPYTEKDLNQRISIFGEGYINITKVKQGLKILNYLPSDTSYYLVKMLEHVGYKVYSIVDEVDPKEIVDKIFYHRIKILQTTPTKVFSIMNYIKDNKIDPKTLPLTKILYIGEGYLNNLTARKLVKKYLNSECFGSAGSTECGSFGKECPFHNGIHFLNIGNNSIFEVINPKTLKHVTKGELVITTLWRTGYPLIKYRTGDYIELDSLPCPCDYPSSRMKLDSFSRYKYFYSINDTKKISLFQFDELIRKYIGINNYFVKILKNRIIIKIEEDELSRQNINQITQTFSKRFNTSIIVKIIKSADRNTCNNWKFNRIFDARNGPHPSLFIKIISRITRIFQKYLNEKGSLHPW